MAAEVRAIEREDIMEEESTSPADVLRTDAYPRQLNPHVRGKNANVPALIEEKLEHLEPEEKHVIRPVLMEYQDLFKKTEDGIIPRTEVGYHGIDTGTAPPVKNPCRIPYALRDEMKMQIEEMVRRGVLTKAATEWAAPVILIRKKSADGTQNIASAQISED
jgi:hypothetical protein